jgi:acetylornithine deacetylase/succinyl-diaminopimelate desuccinylase-like protein
MDFQFFYELLSIDSTSGKERKVAEWLVERLPDLFPASNRPVLRVDEVGDSTLNLLLTWGKPRIVFCSHLDTVPPYIPPTFPEGNLTCHSKGEDTLCHSEEVEDRRKNLVSDVMKDGQSQPAMTESTTLSGSPTVIPGLTRNLPDVIAGRGACDAKGQVFAMVEACKRLAEEGSTDFGLLLLAGEETGSWGAKAFAKTGFKAEYLVVGEPTDNCMVSASKGTKSFDLRFTGIPFHSGYPQYGVSAVDLFVAFVNALKAKDFGMDPVLGETTWNIGLVHSDNPQNILSPELTCRLYFRTTFVSDEAVTQWMAEAPDMLRNGEWMAETPDILKDGRSEPAMTEGTASHQSLAAVSSQPSSVIPGLTFPVIPGSAFPVIPGLTRNLTVTARGGDTPARYWTVPGLPAKSVAFGSDAPHLTNFTHKAICGPGSITVAHRDDECVRAADLATAVEQYVALYRAVTS